MKQYQRCASMDADGKQCDRIVVDFIEYFGDGELYNIFNDKPRWVKIGVCKECLKKFKLSDDDENFKNTIMEIHDREVHKRKQNETNNNL